MTYESVSFGSLAVSFPDDHRFYNVIKLQEVLPHCFIFCMVRNSSNEQLSELCIILVCHLECKRRKTIIQWTLSSQQNNLSNESIWVIPPWPSGKSHFFKQALPFISLLKCQKTNYYTAVLISFKDFKWSRSSHFGIYS